MITVDLDSNDGYDIIEERPFMIINTIAVADNIASDLKNNECVKEEHIYDNINEYVDDIIERIFDDVYVILVNNDVEIY